MDLALPLLHPPLPYRGVEWWWSKVIGSEVVSEEGGAALEQISPEPEVEPSRESGLANRTPATGHRGQLAMKHHLPPMRVTLGI
jgi:hypothetical protein